MEGTNPRGGECNETMKGEVHPVALPLCRVACLAGSARMTGRPCALRSPYGLALLAPSTPKADQKTPVRASIFGAEIPLFAPYGRRMGSRCSPYGRRLCPPPKGRPWLLERTGREPGESLERAGRITFKKAPRGLFLGLSKPFAA